MVMLLTPVILDSARAAAWTEQAERSLDDKF